MAAHLRLDSLKASVMGLSIALLMASITATGCGSSSVTARDADGTSLCQNARRITEVTMRRVVLAEADRSFTFPARIIVTAKSRSKAIVRDLCSLPKMPHGTIACPADAGISYRLDFGVRGRIASDKETVNATGCETVSGSGVVRWSFRSPKFWVTFGRALGIAHPDNATFRGIYKIK